MALPGTNINGPRPLAAVESTRAITPLGDARQENVDRLVRLEVGKQFQAQILSRFNDGTFLVKIADTSARLALPSGGKVGDALALTLLATEPRVTFSLDGQSAGVLAQNATGAAAHADLAPGARIAQALYLSNAASQTASAPLAEGAAPAELSSAGRLVSTLLDAARQEGAATSLIGKTPLANAAGTAAPQLASALHDTLAFSGLFYESHVQQWANGERPLADLLREPQSQLGKAHDAASAVQTDPALLAKMPPAVLEARRNLQEYFSAAPLPPAADTGMGGLASIDPAAAQMINLQLNTLEQQRVQWHGDLWPGQAMEWEVSRQENSGSGAEKNNGDGPQENWQSVVKFTLPSLGVVSATINLRGDRVQIQVRTASDDTASTLQRHGAKLASALDAAGSKLDGLTIRRES